MGWPTTGLVRRALTCRITCLQVLMPTHLKQRCSLPLILRGFLPFKGQYAFHGGFVPADEMPDAEAFRELIEETGTDSV
jgi:ADP-ribose pyrophosphatase YjhB (NUDIX family)